MSLRLGGWAVVQPSLSGTKGTTGNLSVGPVPDMSTGEPVVISHRSNRYRIAFRERAGCTLHLTRPPK